MKAMLRETITFSNVVELYEKLGALDPKFREAAVITSYDYDYEITFGGRENMLMYLTLEAELDVSLEA